MPTLRVAILRPFSWAGAEGAFLTASFQEIEDAVDPDLFVASGVANAPVGGAETPVVSRVAVAGDRLRGFIATSDRAVRFRLSMTGREAIDFRCEVASPAAPVMLPGSFALAAGDTVAISAFNESDQGAASCAAALLWRNHA